MVLTSLSGGNQNASGRVSVSSVTTRGFSSADEANGNTEDDGFRNVSCFRKRAIVTRVKSFPAIGGAVIRTAATNLTGFDFVFGAADADEVAETEELSIAGIIDHDLWDGLLQNRVTSWVFAN